MSDITIIRAQHTIRTEKTTGEIDIPFKGRGKGQRQDERQKLAISSIGIKSALTQYIKD
ncbi:MAG TPA: hypothetical protein VF884_14515 [Nitrososphaeraceae archaeon]